MPGIGEMESIIDIVQQFWVNFQHGQLPDLGSWNYALMAGALIVQGRTSAFFGGIAAAAGYLNLGLIILVAISARVLVDIVWYRIGATGYVDRFGRRFSAYERISNSVHDGVSTRPLRFILIAKLSNGLSMPAVIAAGSANVPIRSWLPASFIGELIWTIPLLMLGYIATDTFGQIEGGLSYFTMGISGIMMMVFVVYVIRSRRNKPAAIDN